MLMYLHVSSMSLRVSNRIQEAELIVKINPKEQVRHTRFGRPAQLAYMSSRAKFLTLTEYRWYIFRQWGSKPQTIFG